MHRQWAALQEVAALGLRLQPILTQRWWASQARSSGDMVHLRGLKAYQAVQLKATLYEGHLNKLLLLLHNINANAGVVSQVRAEEVIMRGVAAGF